MKIGTAFLVVLVAVGLSGCVDNGRYEIAASGNGAGVFRLDKQTGEVCRFVSFYENNEGVLRKEACSQ
jgi:hypothetical protein